MHSGRGDRALHLEGWRSRTLRSGFRSVERGAMFKRDLLPEARDTILGLRGDHT